MVECDDNLCNFKDHLSITKNCYSSIVWLYKELLATVGGDVKW